MKLSLCCLIALSVFSACDKGYDLRFTNYYLEPMDSVVVGNNDVVFTNIELQTSTEFRPLKKGDYTVTCISKTKKRLNTSISIPKKGSGKRTLQVDGLGSFSVLEE